MPTHPLWRPFELTDLEVDVVVTRLPPAQVVVVPYDEHWPEAYAEVERLVRDALGDLVLAIDHTGSTSVPGLAAKPVIDVYAKRDFGTAMTWDLRFAWQSRIGVQRETLFANLDVTNVLNRRNVAEHIDDWAGGYEEFELGRHFQLELGYRF